MEIQIHLQLRRDHFRRDIDIQLPGNGISAVFGPSGCGKTTLLRAIAGLDRHRGNLSVGGQVWQDDSTFLPTHQRPLAYVFQEASLFQHLNVQQNLEYGLKRIAPGQRKISLEQCITLLGIEPLRSRRPQQLSGGETQRVAIARALAVSPQLLLMDEPLTALDSQRKQEILPYIESLQQELDIPVIYVSHSADEVARLADTLVLLDQQTQIYGPIQDMLTRLDLPLAHQPDAEALIQATVAEHDQQFQLTYLDCPAGRFSVAHKHLAPGTQVRLRIAARDVSITLEQQSNTSILNIFPATIEAMQDEGPAQVMLRLNLNGVLLLARITRKSATTLQLSQGKKVYAQAKSVALLA
ncbi:MAG: molybdenum ABC transporter ATP-binding protein [Gammaproteobacteria bacterium]|nr:molybdenum ABC transporter ATP-binding protein [Gammaproteobacteria bacterium]MDH5801467.1 molybdenum ABC transporter ATP-binding protein [Gammaproteobacteria bacterium]